MEIKKVLIVGTGTLGSQIGFQCAMSGFRTTMYDNQADALEASRQGHLRIGEKVKAQIGKTDEEVAATHDNLSYTTDLATAARDCDLVSESVPEDPAIKRQVFTQLHEVCPGHTIFTTNSSTLLPSEIADGTGRPERFLALHFANQIWVNNIGEVMKHPGTDPEVFERVLKFAAEIGMVPIRLEKEWSGYVLNAMLVPLLTAAQTLVANGIATPEDVDRTWMISTKAPSGPFATIDVIGLQTAYTIGDLLATKSGDPQLRKNADYLKDNYLDQGKLGVSSREGFYTYPDPAFLQEDFLTCDNRL
jgi:3-hydroxyacyl-CoA dehydrogenase